MRTTKNRSVIRMPTNHGSSLSQRVQRGIWRYRAEYKRLPYALAMHPDDLRQLIVERHPALAVPSEVRLRCAYLWDEPALLNEIGESFEL